MPNILVNIRWNPPGGRTGLFELNQEEKSFWQNADYRLIIKCQDYDELIEIIRSVGLTIKKRTIHGTKTTFSLDDSTLALLLLHC